MPTEIGRRLSPVERWFWLVDQISPLNVIARVRLTGHLSDAVLMQAADRLAAEHPLLRVSIRAEDNGTHPAFARSSQHIPVCTVRGSGAQWERFVDEQELITPIDWRCGPLIRILDVVGGDAPHETHDLVLTVSHVIADGSTALMLLQRLVVHAHRLTSGSIENAGVPRPVIAAPEDFLPERYRGTRCIARLAVTGVADGLVTALVRPRRLAPEALVHPRRRRSRLVRRTLTSTQLNGLVDRCRRKGVTVHGALTAAMAMVIGPTAAQSASGRICIGSPVNFRAELNPPVSDDVAGSYVNTVPTIVSFGGDRDLWSVAHQVNRSLDRRRRYGQHLASLWAMRFICPRSLATSSTAFGFVERNGPLNVAISNLGRYEFAERIGDWQLSGAQFVSGVPQTGSFLASVNTSHGELFWNFSYAEGVVSPRSAHRFADGCLDTLLSALA